MEVQLARPVHRVGLGQTVAVPLRPRLAHQRLQCVGAQRLLLALHVEVLLEREARGNIQQKRLQRRDLLPHDFETPGGGVGVAQQRIAHRRFTERARSLRQRHAVAALAVRQVAHDPAVKRVAEFVGQRDDVGRRAGVGHVHAGSAGLRESGAIRTGPLAVRHGAFDPAAVRHHAHEVRHRRLHFAVGRGDEIDRGGERCGSFYRAERGRGRAHVPGTEFRFAIGAGHRRDGAPREGRRFLNGNEHRVQRGAADAVHVGGRVEEVHGLLRAAFVVRGQPPAGDCVDGGGAGFFRACPGLVDALPGGATQRLIAALHEAAGLRDAHRLHFIADQHVAAERARQLRVQAAPCADAIDGQRADQVLLVQRQHFQAARPSVVHAERGSRGAGVIQVFGDHRI